MQSESEGTKRMKDFRLLIMFIIGVFLLSIALPRQVAFANDENYWQLEMIGANKAHEEGHNGQDIRIGVVDDIFEEGTHGFVVDRVVKHVAPNASVSKHAAYRYQTSESIELNSNDGTFNVNLPYTLDGSTTLEMTFDSGLDRQTTTMLTIDDSQVVTSSSDEFTDLEVINDNVLKGIYEPGFYKVSFNFTAMTSDSLVTAIQEAIDAGAHIINISLGTLEKDDKVAQKVNAAVEGGAIVVAASGNDGKYKDETYIYYPAAYDNVIAVGAVGEDGNYLEISNYGQVKAPGEYIYDGYIYYGTSIAAPYVTGLTALYMNQQNSKNIKSHILNNIDDNGIVQYESFEKDVADKKALQEAIEVAEEIAAGDYTADSYANLTTALNDAKKVNQEDDARQEEVDGIENSLQIAIKGLVVMEEDPSENEDREESEKPSESEKPDEGEAPDESEELGENEVPSESEAPGKDEESTPINLPTIKVEVGETAPTPVKPNQTIQIGHTGSTIVTPTDLPEGGSIVIKEVDGTDNKVKNATNIENAGDIYTVELVNIDSEDFQGTFTLTLSYDKNAVGTPGIYYYNEDTTKWEKRGGEIDTDARTISLEVAHFSTYGVFVAVASEGDVTPQPEGKDAKKESNENPTTKPKVESDEELNELNPITPDLDYKNRAGVKIIPIDEDVDTKEKSVKDTDNNDKIVVVESDGKELPHTTTSNYNFITVGLLLIFIGALVGLRFKCKTI